MHLLTFLILLFQPKPVTPTRFQEKCSIFKAKSALPMPTLALAIGKSFIKTPYVAGTLEGSPEALRPNLDSVDCVTFVEQTIALTQCIKQHKTLYPNFLAALQKIRYRKGIITDYTSRLHYTSDWLWENEKAGTFTNISQQLGGVPFRFTLSLMSGDADYYKPLADTHLLANIIAIEKQISARKYYYIPKKRVKALQTGIKDGDILMFTCDGKGFDIYHLGFAVRKGKEIYLLHASSARHEVSLSKATLSQYLAKNTSYTGIMVARLNE